MANDAISDDIRRFLNTHITSVEQLEVLLLLYESPTQEWTAAQVYAKLLSNVGSIRNRLQNLCKQGFVTMRQAPEPLYQFQTKLNQGEKTIDKLANLYKDHRIQVIDAIFSKPTGIQHFSDSFRIKKDQDTHG
jgi:DNA-binding MarR family transcriptional regulator